MTNKDNDRVVKTLVLTNSSKSDKKGFNRLVFSDEEDNRYEYTYNNKNSNFCSDVFPYEYIPSLLRDKKFINIAFRISNVKYNPIGGKYIYHITYPKFLGIMNENNNHHINVDNVS
jgi:hypothetical protein